MPLRVVATILIHFGVVFHLDCMFRASAAAAAFTTTTIHNRIPTSSSSSITPTTNQKFDALTRHCGSGHSSLLSSSVVSLTTATASLAQRHLTSPSSTIRMSSTLSSSSSLPPEYQSLRFCDIGANLLDERYLEGIYRGTYRHVPDIEQVIQRAIDSNVRHLIITAGTIAESRRAIQQTRLWNQQYHGRIRFSCTVGVHPTRCSQVFCHPNVTTINAPTTAATATATTSTTTTATDKLEYASLEQQETQEQYAQERIQELYELCKEGMEDHTVVAYGECGLDYDRLEFCPLHIQQYYFQKQLLEIALPLNLPLFLHNRHTHEDLYATLRRIQEQYHAGPQSSHGNDLVDDNTAQSTAVSSMSRLQQWDGIYRGVVHSFDDTLELALLFIQQLHLHIGINGCSLRTEQNIQTMRQLPIDRILLETDCPYCDVRSTHEGYSYIQTHMNQNSQSEKKFILGQMVKSRQEPCHIVQIAEIVAGIQQLPIDVVANTCYDNSVRLFGLNE